MISNKELKENELVAEWLSEHTKGTCKTYLAAFKQFLVFSNLTPESLIELAGDNGKKVKTKLNLWYKHLTEDKKKSWNGARGYENAIKSFCSYHEVPIKTKRRSHAIMNLRKILRRDDVKKLIDYTRNVRDKALYCLAFQSGMSIIDLLALDYGDVQEAIEDKKEVHIVNYIRIKGTINAKTTIGQDSINLLAEYMAFRVRNGEKLEENSPLFVGGLNGKVKRLLQSVALRNIRESGIKTGLLKKNSKFNIVGFHALRSGFASIVKTNGMPVPQIELALGHSDPYMHAYTKFLDSELIENYLAVEEHLTISEGVKHNNRIEELQEQLKEKDFELEVLKEQINQQEKTTDQRISELMKELEHVEARIGEQVEIAMKVYMKKMEKE